MLNAAHAPANSASSGQLRVEAHRQERRLVSECLEYLECIEGPNYPYSAILDFSMEKNAALLGPFLGGSWYLPKSTPPENIVTAGQRLQPRSKNNDMIHKKLLDLWLSTKHEKLAPADRNALLASYSERLLAYSEASALYALVSLTEQSKFFPAWAEVSEILNDFSSERIRMLTSLRNHFTKMTKGKPNGTQ